MGKPTVERDKEFADSIAFRGFCTISKERIHAGKSTNADRSQFKAHVQDIGREMVRELVEAALQEFDEHQGKLKAVLDKP